MILMGDEVRRTQRGNNNAYCHDDDTNWLDWTLLAKHADVHRFVTLLNARRIMRDVEHERQRMNLTQFIGQANKAWHGVKLGQPDWSPHSHSVAFSCELRKAQILFYMILNAHREPLHFELPPLRKDSDNSWRRWIDTALDSPLDIAPWQAAPSIPGCTYRADAHSVVVLFASLTGESG